MFSIYCSVLNEESLLENLRLRYEQGEKIYVSTCFYTALINKIERKGILL